MRGRAIRPDRPARWVGVRRAVRLEAVPGWSGEAPRDRAGVDRSGQDDLEVLRGRDPAKLQRRMHPEVLEVGSAWRGGASERVPLSCDEMPGLAERVRDEGTPPGPAARKRTTVLDVLDPMAVAKAHVRKGGRHLAMRRKGGEWTIVQLLWQSPPQG